MHRLPFCEVMMSAGLRLFWMLSSLFLFAAASFTADDSQSQASTSAAPAKASSAAPTAPPRAAVKPVAEMFHGTTIVDNYRWLEDGKSPETEKWVEAETAYTRALLDPLPGRDAIHKRLAELLSIGSITPPQIAGRHYFYTRREGAQNQPVLYVRERPVTNDQGRLIGNNLDALMGKDRVLVDPNQLSADGTTALDWWQPSDNGKYVAYGTSPGGSEMSTLHIIETRTGTLLPDTIDRTRAASIAWEHDNRGFYYTRYPKKGDVAEGQEVYNRHVFYHELGTDPDGDDPIFGEGRDPEDWSNVSLSNDGRWLLISVEQGYTKTELFLMDLKKGTPPTRVTTGKDFLYRGEVYEGKLYMTTNEDAPRYRVFVTDAGDYEREHWKEIIPQTDAVLQGASVFGGKLFAQYEQNAASQLKIFDLEGKKLADLSLPALGTVFGSGGRWDRDEFFYGFQSFTFAPSIYRYDLKDNSTSLWTKVDAPSIDPSAYEVHQEWFQSKDGTRVPMFIVGKKGLQKNGHNPALLTGYGGFDLSMTPEFNRAAYLWLEHGGIFAVANLRGGAEFGEDWHRAGMLEKKQNVFDDMIAAAEH